MNRDPISPLALIAVFAGVIEASALASLPFLSEDSQTLYTWFLVGFPFFLTVLFFLTLNVNAGSLFAPDRNTSNAHKPRHTPTAGSKGAMIIAISGADSQKIIENHVLRMIERPHGRQRRWMLYNLDTRTCIHISVAPMPDDEATTAALPESQA
ncbi:hypothetical protein [Pseudomonas maumuensis]|uniref:Uncharacterized protein n=1 Tax=Pseudomonas maumuensis TaxID=2842354 RepID=A0ABX8NHM4_9PSED|nr:hypothetical protein [Pseudomonas maumuensis]QXH55612.1 hypothetical protein KSS90_20100 [Pseudomonas maumuensis]